MSSSSSSHHLLELTVISAQDLHTTTQAMQTYAAASIQRNKRLFTPVDQFGNSNPSWNQNFVFQVDENFITSPTSIVTVTLHAIRKGKILPCFMADPILGTVGILVSSLRPSPGTRRFVALQVRRPTSLRPQGILNVSLAILDKNSFAGSLPLSYDIYHSPKFSFLEFMSGRGGMKILHRCTSRDSNEREEDLESKLEMWKAEMSPEIENDNSDSVSDEKIVNNTIMIESRLNLNLVCCFFGGVEV